MDWKTGICRFWDGHSQEVDIQIQLFLHSFSYVCSEEHSSSHPVKNAMNSVLARRSSSTDEQQKQFQEEIKICSCRSGHRKDFFGAGVQPGSCGRRAMFIFLLLQVFSVTYKSLLPWASIPHLLYGGEHFPALQKCEAMHIRGWESSGQ